MKDKWNRFWIKKLKIVIDYMNKVGISTKKIYTLYYSWILNLLKKDLLETQKNMKKVVLKKDYIENKIWVMWWQGLNQAPDLVKRNYQLMNQVFGKENVVLIDKDNYKKYTNIQDNLEKKLNNGDITYTLWSDIVRYNLLMNNGGLWIDSTVIISNKFNSYFQKVKQKEYISLCNKKEDFRYVSHGKWTGWLIGGKRDYKLFRFITCFFETYFKNHTIQIDYMLVDDAAYYYYINNNLHREIIKGQSQVWDPYLFMKNYKSTDFAQIINMFNEERKYSIQKFSYKINANENLSNNTLYHILNESKL